MSGTEKRIDQFEPYVVAWCDKMVEIWRDRIDLLGASPHGNLRASVKAGQRVIEGLGATMAFEFVRYGIYVDTGVGRGYRQDKITGKIISEAKKDADGSLKTAPALRGTYE